MRWYMAWSDVAGTILSPALSSKNVGTPDADRALNFGDFVSSTIVFNVPLSFATFVIPVYGTASNASPANANASTFLAISCKASFTNNFSFVRSNLSINAIAAV